MVDCVIIDEEQNIERTQLLSESFRFINIVKSYTHSIEAARYLRRNKIDLLFVNTDLPTISGLDFYKSFDNSFRVVFFSRSKKNACSAFDLDAIDYLLCPFTDARFYQMVDKVDFFFSSRPSKQKITNEFIIQVRSDHSTLNVDVREIMFIETLGDYVKIHLLRKKAILSLMTLKSLINKLPSDSFIRVHRSYAVSLKFIDLVRGKIIHIGTNEIPIGKSLEKEFFSKYVKENF